MWYCLFLLFSLHCAVIRVDLQSGVGALMELEGRGINRLLTARQKNNSDVFSQVKMPCVNRRSTSARYQLKETFPFKWGATEPRRFFEEMCLAQTRAAASPVFLTAETSLTPDGWSNTSHLSLNPHGSSSLCSPLYRYICRPRCEDTPPLNIYWRLDHLTGFTIFVKANTFVGFAAFALWLHTCHCCGYKDTHTVSSPTIDPG